MISSLPASSRARARWAPRRHRAQRIASGVAAAAAAVEVGSWSFPGSVSGGAVSGQTIDAAFGSGGASGGGSGVAGSNSVAGNVYLIAN